MSTQTQLTSLRTQVVVDAPIEPAFRVFTEDFDRIKPHEHNLLDVEIVDDTRSARRFA